MFFFDDHWWSEHNMRNKALVEPEAAWITEQPLFHCSEPQTIRKLAASLEARKGLAIAHQFNGCKEAAPADVTNLGMIADRFPQHLKQARSHA